MNCSRVAAALPALRASAEYAPGLVGAVWVQVALPMTSLYLLLGTALARWQYFCP
jgi:hypothetical protein